MQQNTLLKKGIRLVKKRIVSLERKYLSRKMNCINHFPKYNTFPVAKKFWYKKVKEFWVYTYSANIKALMCKIPCFLPTMVLFGFCESRQVVYWPYEFVIWNNSFHLNLRPVNIFVLCFLATLTNSPSRHNTDCSWQKIGMHKQMV